MTIPLRNFLYLSLKNTFAGHSPNAHKKKKKSTPVLTPDIENSCRAFSFLIFIYILRFFHASRGMSTVRYAMFHYTVYFLREYTKLVKAGGVTAIHGNHTRVNKNPHKSSLT